jgi:hypothetical protein
MVVIAMEDDDSNPDGEIYHYGGKHNDDLRKRDDSDMQRI